MTPDDRLGNAQFTWRTGAVVAAVALAVLVAMLVLAGGSEDEKPPAAGGSPKPTVTDLELAVWGSEEEVAAYRAVVDDYNTSSSDTSVSLTTWPDADAFLADLRSGAAEPDLYLLPRHALPEAMASGRTAPLLDLVNEREIPIGDDFSREAVSAFSVDDDLQCLPYTLSPMVMYYNTELVDLEAMTEAGLPTPSPDGLSWNFSAFRAAAEFASRPRLKSRGVHIEPTLEGLAPFIVSGGGQVFDDDTTPTRLALGDDGSTDALRQTLEVLRDPSLTLSSKQLAKRPAVEWFKRGRLGMIAGYRSMTPELRQAEGLQFDVLPMPSLGSASTVAELTGLCLAPGRPARVGAAANVLSYLVSDEALARVTQAGFVQPAKLTVAFADAFLQPTTAPAHALVFNNSVRHVVLPPLLADPAALQELVGADVAALLTTPVLDDLAASLDAIDEKSRTLLDPDYEPSEAPSEESSEEPSEEASEDPSAASGAAAG